MSDIKIIEMPNWGASMDEGTIIEWLIDEGTKFKEGDEICEIETSKAVVALEAPFDGRIRRFIAQAGETLEVQKPMAIVADVDVSEEEIDKFLADFDSSVQPGEVL